MKISPFESECNSASFFTHFQTRVFLSVISDLSIKPTCIVQGRRREFCAGKTTISVHCTGGLPSCFIPQNQGNTEVLPILPMTAPLSTKSIIFTQILSSHISLTLQFFSVVLPQGTTPTVKGLFKSRSCGQNEFNFNFVVWNRLQIKRNSVFIFLGRSPRYIVMIE